MPANDVDPEMNTEELRPPASVLRTLAFVRSRGARASVPGPDGSVTPIGIGSGGIAAQLLAQSLAARALSPLTLGSPDWLTALLQRHRFASWSLGLPNLYYFHWLRAAAEESANDGAARSPIAASTRPVSGRVPITGAPLSALSSAQPFTGRPAPVAGAANAPGGYPSPEYVLTRRVPPPDAAAQPSRPADTPVRFDTPRFLPLLPGTLNASSVLAPMLTLHTATAQGRPAAWTDSSRMQFAHPEVLADSVVRRAQTPSRRSNDPAPERTVASPYMPVSYPPVPLASWLGVSASAPEQTAWESAPALVRPQFSPASSHLLALPKIVADVQTRPAFDSPSEAAFAALARPAAARNMAQIAGEASASVQAAQSAAVQPTRPAWPPSPVMPAGSVPVAVAPSSSERQPREPSTTGAEEPAAARRSPLAAAQTALEVVLRLGTQAARTLQARISVPTPAPAPFAEARHTPFFSGLSALRSLPRRRAAEPGDTTRLPSGTDFYGVPSVPLPLERRAGTQTAVSEPTRPAVSPPVLLEQSVAWRHQPITAVLRQQPVASLPSVGQAGGDVDSWLRLPTAFSGLSLPLVSRARLAEQSAEAERQGPMRQSAPQSGASRVPGPVRETARTLPLIPPQLTGATGSILVRTAALSGALGLDAGGTLLPGAAPSETPAFAKSRIAPFSASPQEQGHKAGASTQEGPLPRGTRRAPFRGLSDSAAPPFAAVRAFLGRLTLPRRPSTPAEEATAANRRSIAGMPSVTGSALITGPAFATASSAVTPSRTASSAESAFTWPSPADLPLARRAHASVPLTAEDDAYDAAPLPGNTARPLTIPEPQGAQYPAEFAAGVAARYLGSVPTGGIPSGGIPTGSETLSVQATAPRPRFPSSLATPLLRFLRLADLRRSEDDPRDTRVEETANNSQRRPANRPILGSVPAPVQSIQIASIAAGRLETGQPRRPAASGATANAFPPTAYSLVAPLLRFLRLGDFRRDEALASQPEQARGETGRLLQASGAITEPRRAAEQDFRFARAGELAGGSEWLPTSRAIFGGVPASVQSVRLQTEGDSAGRPDTGQARRRMPAATGAPADVALSALSSFSTPLLRFLRLAGLRRHDPDASDSQQAEPTRTRPQPPVANRAIFGGVPESILPSAIATRMGDRKQAEASAPIFRRLAGTFSARPLFGLPRRAATEAVDTGATFGTREAQGVFVTPQFGSQSLSAQGVSDAAPVAATPTQRFLSRWTQTSVGLSAGPDQAWGGRLFLPRRPLAGPSPDAAAFADAVPGLGNAAPLAETWSERPGGRMSVRPAVSRREPGSVGTGLGAGTSDISDDDMTSTFQAQMLAPIREFLLATLSRVLSPLEALGQMPENRQTVADKTGLGFRPETATSMAWWSFPQEPTDSGATETTPGWSAPAFAALGLPLLSSSAMQEIRGADGLGTQRRQALEAASRRTEFARTGLLALRMAAERVSRSFAGQPVRRAVVASDGLRLRGPQPDTHLPQRQPSGGPFEMGPLLAGGVVAGTTSPQASDATDSQRDTPGLRPLRLPDTAAFLPSRRRWEGTEDGPVRGAERLITQALTSLPVHPATPTPMADGREPLWQGGRTGSALAERVPAMPLPLRGDRQDMATSATSQDPYVIQRAASGTAVASPAPHAQASASEDRADTDHEGGGGPDVHGMATQVWTLLRSRLARESTRAGR